MCQWRLECAVMFRRFPEDSQYGAWCSNTGMPVCHCNQGVDRRDPSPYQCDVLLGSAVGVAQFCAGFCILVLLLEDILPPLTSFSLHIITVHAIARVLQFPLQSHWGQWGLLTWISCHSRPWCSLISFPQISGQKFYHQLIWSQRRMCLYSSPLPICSGSGWACGSWSERQCRGRCRKFLESWVVALSVAVVHNGLANPTESEWIWQLWVVKDQGDVSCLSAMDLCFIKEIAMIFNVSFQLQQL